MQQHGQITYVTTLCSQYSHTDILCLAMSIRLQQHGQITYVARLCSPYSHTDTVCLPMSGRMQQYGQIKLQRDVAGYSHTDTDTSEPKNAAVRSDINTVKIR